MLSTEAVDMLLLQHLVYLKLGVEVLKNSLTETKWNALEKKCKKAVLEIEKVIWKVI